MRLCVIPARGGSKRIPRKNIRLFAGKPIMVWSIQVAQESGLFDRIMVSTEDAEIADVAIRYGAEIPYLRPADLADDHTGTNAVVRQAIVWHGEHGYTVDHACCLYATAPMVQSQFIKEGFELLINSDKAFVFSITRYHFPVQRAIRLNEHGEIEAIYPQYRSVRSQDLEPAYHDAGQFYWGTAKAFMEETPLFASTSLPVILPSHLVQDIDTEDDWRRAELLFQAWQQHGKE